MDAIWKRTYDALTQLRREIVEKNPETGTQHMGDAKRFDMLKALDAVREDVNSCKRLGEILMGVDA
jgi:hypothetical protein